MRTGSSSESTEFERRGWRRASVAGGGVVLVGTARTLASLWAWALASGIGNRIAGALSPVDGGAAPEGLTVLGDIGDLPALSKVGAAERLLVCLHKDQIGVLERLRSAASAAGLALHRVPPLDEALESPEVDQPARAAGAVGAIDFDALLGRSVRGIDRGPVARALGGRRVLITGAGGSIGSELARRCAAYEPSLLVLVERSENALFEIDRQIGAAFPGVARRALLHDVVDAAATLRRFRELEPEIVFHAAAHKHVPMMEDHPAAAVRNNFFGTKSVADASLSVGVRRFVMISTDKAVNPTSVMGATKRLAELYVRTLNAAARERGRSSRFCLVRFGNVLGSACSVLPVWSAQLNEGGPVTVTHPAMTRYFMTIPEAASLVIQAGSLGDEGPADERSAVFVLDMGDPVRICDLADRFVRANGFAPIWEDPIGVAPEFTARMNARPAHATPPMRVVFIGARPGEKIHEELAYDAEELLPTPAEGVLAWSGQDPDKDRIDLAVRDLETACAGESRTRVLEAIRLHVPEMANWEGQQPRMEQPVAA